MPWLSPPTSPQRQSINHAITGEYGQFRLDSPARRRAGKAPRQMGSQSTAKRHTPTAPIPLLLQPTPARHKGASSLPLAPSYALACLYVPPWTPAAHSPHHAPGPGRGNKHLNPTVPAMPHSPSSTPAPITAYAGKDRHHTASHNRLPRLRDTRALTWLRNGNCSQSAQ